MKKINLKTNNAERKLIWRKIRCYIDCIIMVCCLVVAFNIHPNSSIQTTNDNTEKNIMKYIFHDYDWNTYILNDTTHGTTNSLDYLFNEDIPDSLKNDTGNLTWTASLANATKNQETTPENENVDTENNIKDNQISIDEIIQELWSDEISGDLVIDFDNLISDTWDNQDAYYTVTENSDWTVIVISKNNGETVNEESNVDEEENTVSEPYLTGKVFTFIVDGYVQPILIPRDQLVFNKSGRTITYIDDTGYINIEDAKTWVTIIDEYEDCMTPRWYKIVHWDSVLAYKQMDNAPDICNIERRFCWKGKLSGTYTQQWCSINTNYTYTQRWEAEVSTKDEDVTPDVVQNPDWSVKVNDKEIWSSFFFERPSKKSTPWYYQSDNIVVDEEVEQTTRPHRGCTTPWWEKMKHWEIVQAFKHANGFSDAPCQAQIRLCSMWDLMWSYTQPNCKTRDTSFIDRINGSPTWETYSKEKLDWVKKLIKAEQSYNVDYGRRTNIDELDRILDILEA